MIELTKTQFDNLLTRISIFGTNQGDGIGGMSISELMHCLVITKYHLQIGVSNIIAKNTIIGAKGPFYLFDQSNFQFNGATNWVGYYAANSSTIGFSYDTTTHDLSFTPDQSTYQSTTGYYDFVLFSFNAQLGNTAEVYNFNGTNIKSIDYVGNDYRNISFNGNCPYLEEINLSNNRDNLNSFYGDVMITGKVPSVFNGNFNAINFNGSTFAGSNIKKMVFPTATANYSIPDSCFEGCTQLLEVVIPSSVVSIGKNAFKKCTNLRYVYISETVNTIGEGAFEDCTYDALEFEVSYQNTKFLGELGALLRKNPDKTYSVIHATGIWLADWSGVYTPTEAPHHMVYLASDLPSYITPSNQRVDTLMVDTNYNEYQMKDIHGTSFSGRPVIPSQTSSYQNVYNSVRQDGTLMFAIPVFKLVTDFEPRACMNCNMNSLKFRVWDSLASIGKEAFKGAQVSLQWPPKYGFTTDATSDYSDYTMFTQSYANTFNISESAFEGCNVTGLNLNKTTVFGEKAFYGCPNLTTIDFRTYTPVVDLDYDAQQGTINYVTSNCSIGKLCFGNTPNLASITCSPSDTSNTVRYNAIGKFGANYGEILVGCQSTDLQALATSYGTDTILENAFYGCTHFTLNDPSTAFDNYQLIGNSAFYGCSSLVSTIANPINFHGKVFQTVTYHGQIQNYKSAVTFGDKAFYGCFGIQYLNINTGVNGLNPYEDWMYVLVGSKSFANTGITKIDFGPQCMEVVVPDSALDVFDGCPLDVINVYNNGDFTLNTLQHTDGEDPYMSALYVDNGLFRNIFGNGQMLIKSGTGKAIVNDPFFSETRNLTRIVDNAFTGVNLNDGNNTNIHIPKTVNVIGKNILANSKTDNSVTGNPNNPCNLLLDGIIQSRVISNCLHLPTTTDPTTLSVGMLYYLGGRYFQKIVEDTMQNQSDGYHYYYVEENTHIQTNKPYLTVKVDGTSSGGDQTLAEIGYDTQNNIVITIYKAVTWNYADKDYDAHTVELSNPIDLILMYNNQQFTTVEESIYCNSGTAPGTTWCGTLIPNDITRAAKLNSYLNYTSISAGAFSDCKWVRNVVSQKMINNLQNAFKGCVNLQTVRPADTMQTPGNLSVNIYEGTIPNGTFDGCTNFIALTGANSQSSFQYPIIFGDNSFNGCEALSDGEMLHYGIQFGANSFVKTGFDEINLASAISINPTAFKNCDAMIAKADSTCGYYFTSEDGYSIVDNENIIVVGSLYSSLNGVKGVGDYAFYGKKVECSYEVNGTSDFTIGTEAFCNSSIKSYLEDRCQDTVIGTKAFKDCIDLQTIAFNEGCVINASAFEGCTTLSEVTIPTETDIPANAFKGCTSLPSFTSGGNIGENAFNGCTLMTSFDFVYPAESTSVFAPSAFIGCPLTNIYYIEDGSVYGFDSNTVYRYNEDGHIEVVIGTKGFTFSNPNYNYRIKSIGEHAYNGRGLTGEIIIPETVTEIHDYAFANNPGITKVHIPTTVEYIGAHAFDGCTSLVRASIPDSCTFIGQGAFKGCILTEGFNCNTYDDRYHISNPLSEYKITTGGGTTIKSSLDLSNTLFTEIEEGVFSGSQLEVVKLPLNCAKIGPRAFYSCIRLSELHIYSPNGIDIHPEAFYTCQKLSDIYLERKIVPTIVTQSDPSHFYNVGGDVTPISDRHLHVPVGLETDTNFISSEFYRRLVLERNFTVIADLDE